MHDFKHLTEENRKNIEFFLDKGLSFSKIATIIDKDRTTIAKEIKRYRIKKIPKNHDRYIQRNFCVYKFRCGKPNCSSSKSCYLEDICPKLLKPPYVCNACSERRYCKKIKYYYFSNSAHKSYLQTLSESRIGINITEDKLAIIDKTISPLLKENKQPINHNIVLL